MFFTGGADAGGAANVDHAAAVGALEGEAHASGTAEAGVAVGVHVAGWIHGVALGCRVIDTNVH